MEKKIYLFFVFFLLTLLENVVISLKVIEEECRNLKFNLDDFRPVLQKMILKIGYEKLIFFWY